MHQSFPVHDLPNGKSVYQDSGGTFSHQHPVHPGWCERHVSIQEALDCYDAQDREARAEKATP